jgi:hypothetical protein
MPLVSNSLPTSQRGKDWRETMHGSFGASLSTAGMLISREASDQEEEEEEEEEERNRCHWYLQGLQFN